MVDSLSNMLPINIVGVVSGTLASGTPTAIFSRATVQNVIIVTEDPIPVELTGGLDPFVAATGTFSESLTISGQPVATGTGGGGGLNNVVEDTTPELGGTLDALNNDILNINAFTAVTGTVTSGITFGTGSITITGDAIQFPEGSEGRPTLYGPAQRTGIWFSKDNPNPAIEFANQTQDAFRITTDNTAGVVFEARNNEAKIHAGGDSTVAFPGFAFNTAASTGMYLPGENVFNLALVVTGTEILTVSGHANALGDPIGKGILVNGQVTAEAGTFSTVLTVSGIPVAAQGNATHHSSTLSNRVASGATALNFETPDKDNRLLLVSMFSLGQNRLETLTYNGIQMSAITGGEPGTFSNDDMSGRMFGLVNPPVGSHDLIGTTSEASSYAVVAAMFFDVEPFLPIATAAIDFDTTGASAIADVNIMTEQPGSLIWATTAFLGGDTDPFTPDSGQNEVIDSGTGPSTSADFGVAAGFQIGPTPAGATEVQWTASASDASVILAVEIQSVGSTRGIPGKVRPGVENTAGSPILLPDSGLGRPSLAFASNTDTGMFKIANSSTLGFVTDGTSRLELATGINIFKNGAVQFQAGNAGAPGMAFEVDPNTGIFRSGIDQLAISCGGTELFRVVENGATGDHVNVVSGTDTRFGVNLAAATRPSDTIEVAGGLTAVGGTFSQSLTISGVPVATGTGGGGGLDTNLIGVTESTPVFIPFPGSGIDGTGDGSENITWIYDYNVEVQQSTVKTVSGSLTYSLLLDGVVVEGLDNQPASGTQAVDLATAAGTYTAGDEITLAISGAVNAFNFRFGLKAERT